MKLHRAIILAAALGIAGALLAVGGRAALSLLLYGGVTLGVVVLWPFARRLPFPKMLGEIGGPLILAAFTIALTPYLLRLDPVISHDNPLHLFKAWQTWKLLGSGRLIGWSDLLDAGMPANHLYPPGGAFLTCFFKAICFGKISFEKALALTQLATVLATPLGLYAVARRPLGILPAMASGALAAIEGGWFFEGGFDFNLYWGVFGSALAVGLAFLSLAALHRYALLGTHGALAAASLTFAAAVLVHPLALVLVLVVAPLRTAQAALAPGAGDDPTVPPLLLAGRAAMALAFGLLLSAFFLWPFMADGVRWAIKVGLPWAPLSDIVSGLFNGGALRGTLPAFVGAGLFGICVASLAGRRFALVAAAALGLFMVMSSREALVPLGLTRLFGSLESMQVERFTYFIKALLWLGVGVGLSLALENLKPTAGVSRWVAGALAGLLVAPIGFTSPRANLLRWFPVPPLNSSDPVARDARSIGAILKSRAAALGPGRVLEMGGDANDHTLSAVPAYADLPGARIGYPATELYNGVAGSTDPTVLDLQGVRFVATRGPDPGPPFEKKESVGGIRVWERQGDLPPRARVEGGGTASVLSLVDGEAQVQVEGAAPDSTLVVGISPFDGWTAESGGQDLPLGIATYAGVSFFQVPAHNGLTVFRYHGTPAAKAGAALSLLALLALGFLLAFRRLPAPALALRWAPAVPSLAIAGAALLVVVLAARAVFPSGPWDLRKSLEGISVTKDGKPCTLYSGSEGFGCPSRAGVHRALVNAAARTRACVLVEGRSKVDLSATIRLGKTLHLALSRQDGPPGNVQTTVDVKGLPPVDLRGGLGTVEQDLDTSFLAGRTALVTFHADGTVGADPCLEATVIP